MPMAHPELPADLPVNRFAVRPELRPATRRPIRLTRRGRLVLLLACLLLAAAVAAVAAPASRAADPPSGAPEPAVAVVRPGDTLWSVAARHLPSHDAYGMIEEIRHLNRLSGHTIHPGQRLILPPPR